MIEFCADEGKFVRIPPRPRRSEDDLDACPFCETPTRYSPGADGGPRYGMTFWWTNWYSPSTSPTGAWLEVTFCGTCKGELYRGRMR